MIKFTRVEKPIAKFIFFKSRLFKVVVNAMKAYYFSFYIIHINSKNI